MGNKAAFLDRDGTIAEDTGYCQSPDAFKLFPVSAEAIKLLNRYGYKVILITNQSGIARGYFTEDTLAEIHQKMKTQLANEGAYIDAIYWCPHHPDDNCDCRKPNPELVFRALQDFGVELKGSCVIGDKPSDIELGRNVDCGTIQITSEESDDFTSRADITAPDLLSAVQRWLKSEGTYDGS